MKTFLLKRSLWLFMLVMLCGSLWAQIPNGYYNAAEGLYGDELKAALHEIIKGHSVVSYKNIIYAYADIDVDENNEIIDIYSKDYHFSPTDNCSNTPGVAGVCWNREHVWCQSWFGDSDGSVKSDLFHVYPTDSYVNSRRLNYPFAEVKNVTYTSNNGSKLGTSKTPGYDGTAFEPIDEYKGDIARSLFYVSVRYYGEDASWSSNASEMTTKSVINDWAMKMLLQWNELDPVSQKEIDRNNKIYADYQHNRNPFIDHPEYARMIWDGNWTWGDYHNLTAETGLDGGSISVPEQALEGTTVSITATPNPGWMVKSYSAWETGHENNTIEVSTNGTFVMPKYAVTVSATFELNTTLYDITILQPEGGIIEAKTADETASTESALSGTIITLTYTPDEGNELLSWYVYKTNDINTLVSVNNDSFVMPAFNVTISASFGEPSVIAYEKVTTEPDDWSGEYLIVNEDYNVAFNGTIENNWGRCSEVTINNNTIEGDATTETYEVTVSKEGTGYKFLFPSGKYMNWTGEKKFTEGTSAVAYDLSLSNDKVVIASGEYQIMYNYSQGSGGLRSYKSTSNMKPVQLYKKTGSVAVPTHTITFHNGEDIATQVVNEYEATPLQANTFTKDGFAFDGWNTEVGGTGTYYADGATVTLIADLDLYAQWNELFSITCTEVEGGTISASLTEAVEEETIELIAVPQQGYAFYKWTVTDEDGDAVNVIENEFIMPASNVTVTATFVYVGQTTTEGGNYTLVTSNDELVSGKTYLIVNVDAGYAMSTNQKSNNRGATAVIIEEGTTISEISDDVCEFMLGGSADYWTFYDAFNNGYLHAASSTANYLRTRANNNDDNGKWKITIATNGTASIVAHGDFTRNVMQYNPNGSGDPLFACYGSASQKPVALFVKNDAIANNIILSTDDSDLPEGQKNADLLTANIGEKANVVLYGRTLYKDGAWNTLCLPFDLEMAESPLAGATLKELSSASISGTTMTVNFTESNAIVAGKPYLIKWEDGEDITDPLFTGVTISAEQPTAVSFDDLSGAFMGTFSPVSIKANDTSVLFLSTDDTLYYPGQNRTVGAFFAYFQLANGEAPTRFVLNFDEATGIKQTTDNRQETTIYDLQGRHVEKPVKGLYIQNGKKVFVK